jgi:CubicO group peptidase (beta-lactamase class C family)
MKPESWIFAIAALAVVSSGGSAAGPRSKYDFSAVNSELARECRTGEFAGVVLVRAHGRDLYEKECGEADLVNRVPITRATRFRIHSTSKLLTALTVMRLVEQGKIGLDRSILDYIPEAPPEWKPVTIRTLLNHTSGIPDYTELMLYHFRADQPSAMRVTLAALSREQRQLKTKPGERFSYNNFGFELLADVVERASGEPFAKAVQELVLGPAGMKTASIESPNIVDGHPVGVTEDGLALGYNGSPAKLEQSIPWSFVQLGAGAVRASADDFVALDEALSAGKIIKPETWLTMTSDAVRPPPGAREGTDNTWGLGVNLEEHDGVRLQGHKGGSNGYISAFERFPDDGAMMIVLSNRGFTKTAWLREGVAKVLKQAR